MTPPPRGPLRRAGRMIDALEISAGSVMLLTIFVLVLIQAAQRHLPGESLPWTGEVSRFALAWLTFTVAGVLISRGGHITLEVVDILPKPRLIRAVQVFALVIVAVTAGAFTLEAWDLVQTQGALRSPVLGLSMALVYVPVLLGLISSTVRALIGAARIALHGPVRSELAEEVAR
ncbi:TRAP transporter small permease subunit [Nesterenkonia sp. CL21]|uniref:TRAP transporter small permease n=1 Tax=Nesterenkonia sp. CL21 TaxID=3064894 RepID=UPI0028795CD2|nr:TRAP transporter small permease subunit [Nesterenkonia sp. CL21]MDS2173878.1 TRAP transporter small permease subunit [Nesterenkonia sp. CL21]